MKLLINLLKRRSTGLWVLSRTLSAIGFFCIATGAISQTDLPSLFPNALPVCTCEDLRKTVISNTIIDSAVTDAYGNACWITATLTHPPATDQVKIFVGLPMKNWNGRFMGTGGGGYVGGQRKNLNRWLPKGFATAATNTGHDGGSGSFAMDQQQKLRWPEILDNAYLGIHDMTIVAKTLTERFYGKAPRYAYFFGHSTGGRQGVTEAQRYPEDYDGIMSGCPAINWQRFIPALMWPQAVMLEAKNFVSPEKLRAVNVAAIASCDRLDGVMDSVMDNPLLCTYDPGLLVGARVGDELFTEKDAEVVRKIWQGARDHKGKFLWYGMTRGSSFGALAGTQGNPLTGDPFDISLDWLKYFLLRDPNWDWTHMTPKQYERLWHQSVKEYGDVYGPDNADLTPFFKRGGKLIITHGLSDEIIFPQGAIDYYERVQRQMGGLEKTKTFLRLFMAPGVDHGFQGAGPSPTGEMDAVIRWVEQGQAPERLLAEKRDNSGRLLRSRPLYPYPAVAKYKGSGSTDDAANFISSDAKE